MSKPNKLVRFDWALKSNLHAKGLLEAKEKLDSLKLSESEQQEYNHYLENLRYQESMVDSSFRSGKIEGKAEGITIGKAEGAIQVKQEIVLAMHHKHVAIDDIAMFVNLSTLYTSKLSLGYLRKAA